LAAGLSYRASGWVLPFNVEKYFLLGLSSFFLACTLLTKRSPSLRRYWQIPFAFLLFALSGLLDLFITNEFVVDVIHQTSTATNPLASTILGTFLAQLVSTLSIVTPIVLLTKWSGVGLTSIFIEREKVWKGLRIGLVGFTFFYFLTFSGLLQPVFPNNGISPSRFFELTPAILFLALSNGLREELWFRALFLKNYGKFLGPLPSNLIQATIFASFHLQVRYTQYLLLFVGITFILGLWLGHLMQKSGNLLGPSVFHAGADIPIYLVFLSSASP
jgi:membrane protease YdiL (CAAX protease family)